MNRKEVPQKIAFVSDYLPRKCGIATFTFDLRNAFTSQFPQSESIVIPVTDSGNHYDYPSEVRFEIIEQDLASYQRAADYVNFNNTDVVCLQHEFGIYGGQSGSHILAFLRDLRIPVVTTFHTVLREPTREQARVMRQIIRFSARIVVMSEKAKTFLTDFYNAPDEKIDLIPHGIPDMPFVDPNFYKDQFGVEGRNVILTFGLLSPNKGIEYVLQALPNVIAEYPETVYIILGATHPSLVKEQGESYRLSLERLAYDLGINKSVIFYNRFVEAEELKAFLGAADIYITPYLNREQVTSGTLAYSFGCGKAVISTPYWHAEELLAEERGVIVPFADSDAIAYELINLLSDGTKRHAMRKKAYMLGREMVWNNIIHLYTDSFQKARLSKHIKEFKPYAVKTLEEKRADLPSIKLDHLIRMTDSVGLFHHAKITVPNYEQGYTADDNARALILTILLEELGYESGKVHGLESKYAAFLNHAFNPSTKRFRNFMSFDRKWHEEIGSDDCQGRTLWALGACIGKSGSKNFQIWGMQMFNQVLDSITELESPRSCAFALKGIHEYLSKLSGDRLAYQTCEVLMNKLINLYEQTSVNDWQWFEKVLSYDNASLSHALLIGGYWTGNENAYNIGMDSLNWLIELQTAEQGHFCPIGCNGFYPYGGARARYDQQPIEAYTTISACLFAFSLTENKIWLERARRIFEWFLGRNDLGLEIYDTQSGGCHDALHVDRINQNQGAESTLAFLLSLAELQIVENSLKTFETASSQSVESKIII